MLLDDPKKAEEIFNSLMMHSALKGKCRICHSETNYEVAWGSRQRYSNLPYDSARFINSLLDYFVKSQYKTTTFISKGSKATSLLWFWFCSPECLKSFYEEIFPLMLYSATTKK